LIVQRPLWLDYIYFQTPDELSIRHFFLLDLFEALANTKREYLVFDLEASGMRVSLAYQGLRLTYQSLFESIRR
jgi:hypothetical protein